MIILTLIPVTTLDFLASYLYPTYKTLALMSRASARSKIVKKSLVSVSRRSGQPLRLASRKINDDIDENGY